MAQRALPTTRRADGISPRPFEHLEPRLVLSAPYDFAAVGIRFDNGPQVFLADAVVNADDSITGSMQFADAAGTRTSGPMDWTSLIRADEGAFTFGTRDGFTPYAAQLGTQFIAEDRWLLGSFVGNDPQGAPRDFAVLGQVETSSPGLSFVFDMSMTRLTASGAVETFDLTVLVVFSTIDDNLFRFTYDLPSGTVTDDKVLVAGDGGRLEFDSGEVLIFSHSVNSELTPVFMADLDAADGLVGIAVGRAVGNTSQDGFAGRLRTAALIDGPLAAAFFGVNPSLVTPGNPVAANVVIEFHFWSPDDHDSLPNTFSVYRQSEWDDGVRTPVTQGTWIYDTLPLLGFGNPRSVLRLTSDAGVTLTLRQAFHRVITFHDISDGLTTERPQGLGSAIVYRNGGVQEVLVHADPDGRPIAYVELASSTEPAQTYSVDLIREVGGEAVVGDPVTWLTTPANGFDRSVAGRSASGDILLWRLGADGISWSFVNLTDALPGARPINSDLFNTGSITSNRVVDAFGNVPAAVNFQTLAGYDADGNFIVYRWSAGPFIHASRWTFVDVEADGVESAGFVPDVVGGLSGWTSSWGASHFAGVDADGELWAIWWAPGLERWHVDSLTDNAGVPTLRAERPAAIQTSWDAFHIFATDPQGHVVVTWWGTDFTNWQTRDLTTEFGGPALHAGLTANFSNPLHTINVVGLDDQGHAAVYWWTIGATWRINSLSQGIQPADVPISPWLMTWSAYPNFQNVTTSASQSLLGRNADGDLVRLVWRLHAADAWLLEDVTSMSTPYVV